MNNLQNYENPPYIAVTCIPLLSIYIIREHRGAQSIILLVNVVNKYLYYRSLCLYMYENIHCIYLRFPTFLEDIDPEYGLFIV